MYYEKGPALGEFLHNGSKKPILPLIYFISLQVTHKINQKEMVLKLNKHRSNRTNMLKEIQLMKSFDNPNILR